MSAKQAAFLTSRLLCLWFAYHVVSSLLALPSLYLLYSAVQTLTNAAPRNSEYLSKMLDSSALSLIDVCLQLIMAIVLYRAGPRVLQFFSGQEKHESTSIPIQTAE